MSRPEFITSEDIARWSKIIDEDENIPKEFAAVEIIREVCYAGQWLAEQLIELGCDSATIGQIQFTCGKLSFGRDPWSVHQVILENYKNNLLVFEREPKELN